MRTTSRWPGPSTLGGRAYLTPAVVKGVQLVRVSIGATATTADDLVGLWAQLRETPAAR